MQDLRASTLEFLVVCVELGHLGHTASRLGMTDASASRLLAKARETFGDELFVKHGRGVTPTRKALLIARQAKPILEALHRLGHEEDFDAQNLTRVFRVACLGAALSPMIDPFFGALRERAPKAGLALELHNESTCERLRDGAIDFAVFPIGHHPCDCKSRLLFETPYVHVVRSGHPLEALLKTPDALAQALCGAPRAQIVVHPDRDEIIDGVPGHCTPPDRTQTSSLWSPFWLGSLLMAVRHDLVITLPRRLVQSLADIVPLTALGVAQPGLKLKPHLVWHAHHEEDPAHAFARCIFLESIKRHREVDVVTGPVPALLTA